MIAKKTSTSTDRFCIVGHCLIFSNFVYNGVDSLLSIEKS